VLYVILGDGESGDRDVLGVDPKQFRKEMGIGTWLYRGVTRRLGETIMKSSQNFGAAVEL